MRVAVQTADRGAIVRLARRAEGWTQADLGTRCGYSASTISRLESGAQPLSSIELLRTLSAVLRIPPALLGLSPVLRHAESTWPHSARPASTVGENNVEEDGDSVRRRELLAGLTGLGTASLFVQASGTSLAAPTPATHFVPAALFETASSEAVLPPNVLAGRFAAARAAFDSCHYQQLASLLPRLIADSRVSRSQHQGIDSDRCSAVLARAYKLAGELCFKLNEDGAAWVASDRGLCAARESGHAATIADATQGVAIALRRHGHYDTAGSLLTQTADELMTAESTPRVLAACSSLLCTAAYASAQASDRERAVELLDEAESAVGGEPNAASVNIYRIGIFNTLGEPGRALTYARGIRPDALPTAERYARYCIDTARAWQQYGKPANAYQALRAAESHAPEEIRRPSVRNLISTLLYSKGNQPTGLRALAARAGTAGS
ncbi:helix-turn-helix domain-containing protein [Flindersiella endophytica]